VRSNEIGRTSKKRTLLIVDVLGQHRRANSLQGTRTRKQKAEPTERRKGQAVINQAHDVEKTRKVLPPSKEVG
jgi:hypothetical protein